MDLDFHSGTRKSVMPKKKFLLHGTLKTTHFITQNRKSKKESQNFKLCFPEVSPLSASSLRTVFQEIALSENPNTKKKRYSPPAFIESEVRTRALRRGTAPEAAALDRSAISTVHWTAPLLNSSAVYKQR
jgi:hypothetical protein